MKQLLIALIFIPFFCTAQNRPRVEDEFCFAHIGLNPLKMNLFYEGVDNPIEIILLNNNPDSIDIKVSQGELSKVSGGYVINNSTSRYIINNLKSGEVIFKFYKADKFIHSKTVRVKNLPKPKLSINGIDGPEIHSNQLGSINNIEGLILDFDFNVVPRVNSFIVKIVREGKVVSQNSNIGAELSKANRTMIGQLKFGDILLFEEIEFDYVWFPSSERERVIKSEINKLIYYIMY